MRETDGKHVPKMQEICTDGVQWGEWSQEVSERGMEWDGYSRWKQGRYKRGGDCAAMDVK
jgi:hypothetical protein